MTKFITATIITILSLILTGCGGCSSNSGGSSWSDYDSYSNYSEYDYAEEEPAYEYEYGNSIKIPFTEEYGNIITIPVKINGMGLNMIFDTGASSICITLAEAEYLYQKGNLQAEDFIELQEFQTADGSISVGLRINLRYVTIGDKITLQNVEAIVVQNQQAPLLLGQSVMRQFREISVDRENKVVKFFQ